MGMVLVVLEVGLVVPGLVLVVVFVCSLAQGSE